MCPLPDCVHHEIEREEALSLLVGIRWIIVDGDESRFVLVPNRAKPPIAILQLDSETGWNALAFYDFT